ncbi:FAD-dependent oxidoreductase [Klenkia terrae]|uniref:FAD-dependent oxidoreductase n=1 Tax=Klenkia terrae TaxID=1052259 RepID=UPI0036135ACB
MTADQTFDVIVIGAGSTGENVADVVVKGGLTAVLVESELVGGECSYWACMPSKALLRGTEVLEEARAVGGAAAAVTGEQDVAATLARRNSFTSNWDDSGQVTWVDGAGIALVRGAGRLDGEKRVVVTAADGSTSTLTARHAVVVCTGSEAAVPPLEGIDDVEVWTAREATSAQQVPGRLVILGGGVVGVEMATAWSALGSQVTLLQRGDRLLAGQEPEAGDAVAASLRDRGVDVQLNTSVTAVRKDGDGVVVVTGAGEVRGDQFLVAAGRRARTGDIGLDTVGLAPGSTWTSTTPSGSAAWTGSTASATPTAAGCSPTWASTRPARPPRRSSPGPPASRSRWPTGHRSSPPPTPRPPRR